MVKKAKDDDPVECLARAQSEAMPDHVHTCIGNHFQDNSDHFCGECMRWWALQLTE